MAVGVYQQSQAGGYFLVERRPGGKLTGSYVFTAEIFQLGVSRSGPYSVTMQLNNEAVLLMTSLPILETSGAPLLNYGTGLTKLIKLDGVIGFYAGLNGWIAAINAVPPATTGVLTAGVWTIKYTFNKDGAGVVALNGAGGAAMVQTLLSLYRVNRYQRTDLTESQFAAIAGTALGHTAVDRGNSYLYGDVAGDVMPGGAEAQAGATPPAEGPDIGLAYVLDVGKSDGVRQTITPRRGVLTANAVQNADTPTVSTWMDITVSGADWDADGEGGLTGLNCTVLRLEGAKQDVFAIVKVKAADTLTIDVVGADAPALGDTIILGAIGWKIWTPRMDCGLPLDKKEFRRLWIKVRSKTADYSKVMVRAKVFLDGKAAQNLPDSDNLSINEDGLTTVTGRAERESDAATGLIRFPIPLGGLIGVDVQILLFGFEADTPVEFEQNMELEYQVVKSDERAR